MGWERTYSRIEDRLKVKTLLCPHLRASFNAPNPFVSTITAQDFAPPAASPFAQAVEAAIAVRLGKKRYTKPSTELGEPSTFAESLVKAVDRRRRGYAAIN